MSIAQQHPGPQQRFLPALSAGWTRAAGMLPPASATAVRLLGHSPRRARTRGVGFRLTLIMIMAVPLVPAIAPAAPASATVPSTSGTDFWVAFPRPYSNPGVTPVLELFVASDLDTTGTVTGSALGSPITFSVLAGSVTTVSIPSNALSTATGVQDIGLRVTTAAPVSLYGINRQSAITDAFTAIPVSGLGRRYRIAAATSTFQTSTFAVVSTTDGTTVTIDGGAPITIDAGEAYIEEPAGDASGTLVESSEPVAVFSGHRCSNFKGTNCDLLIEQLPPTDAFGTEFAVVRFANEDTTAGRTNDAFKIIADRDGTVVSVDGVDAGTLSAGQSLVVEPYGLDGASTLNGGLITTSEPALVVHYMSTGRYRTGAVSTVTGDPSMTLVTPTDQYRTSVLFATMAAGFAFNAVNVVIPSSGVDTVRLDGAALPAGTFRQLGTSTFSGAQIVIDTGPHALTADVAFGATVYGANLADSYALPGGVGAAAVTVVSSPPTESYAGPFLSCDAVVITGSRAACAITGGDPGIDILWRLRDPDEQVIAEGPVTLDDVGNGTIELTLPSGLAGTMTIELVDWGVTATFDVTGPVPTAVRAGEGAAPTSWLVVTLLAMAGTLALGVPRTRVSPRG